ncbi:MAG: hypothetical protein P8184_20940, partial [Calditrichia bacterium]
FQFVVVSSVQNNVSFLLFEELLETLFCKILRVPPGFSCLPGYDLQDSGQDDKSPTLKCITKKFPAG